MGDALGTDTVFVYRGGANYSLQVQNLANLLDTDLVAVQRAGVLYHETGLNVKADLPSGPSYDPDAQDYITRVEAADGEALETAVKDAINQLFIDIKAISPDLANGEMYLYQGVRTIQALEQPLFTNFVANGTGCVAGNLTQGDYDRTTGLKGNGVDKQMLLQSSPLQLVPSVNDGFVMIIRITELTTVDGRYVGAIDESLSGTQRAISDIQRSGSSTQATIHGLPVAETSFAATGVWASSKWASESRNRLYRPDNAATTGSSGGLASSPCKERSAALQLGTFSSSRHTNGRISFAGQVPMTYNLNDAHIPLSAAIEAASDAITAALTP